MYTILIQNQGNTAVATERQAILQNSKLVDVLRFIVPQEYNGHQMKDFAFFVEYLTPISHRVKTELLNLVDVNYKDEYLLYTTNFDTGLTAENGDVEMNLYFIKAGLDADGNSIEQVRKIIPISIPIIPIASFFTVPDDALDSIVQLYLQNQKLLEAQAELAKIYDKTKLDSIKLDTESGEIYGTCKGEAAGERIDLNALADELVERGGDSHGNIKIQMI